MNDKQINGINAPQFCGEIVAAPTYDQALLLVNGIIEDEGRAAGILEMLSGVNLNMHYDEINGVPGWTAERLGTLFTTLGSVLSKGVPARTPAASFAGKSTVG